MDTIKNAEKSIVAHIFAKFKYVYSVYSTLTSFMAFQPCSSLVSEVFPIKTAKI